jgi:hypothetical protein
MLFKNAEIPVSNMGWNFDPVLVIGFFLFPGGIINV